MSTAISVAVEPLAAPRHRLHVARLAFRRWRKTRPFWAGIWTMLGGALIAYVPATAFKFFLMASGSLVLGVLVGVFIGVSGLMLWFIKPLRIFLGVVIVLLSLASFMTSDFGGLILGMLMGLIGGSLALAWVPQKTTWRQRRRARQAAATEAVIEPMQADTITIPEPRTIDLNDADTVIDVTEHDDAIFDVEEGTGDNSRHMHFLGRSGRPAPRHRKD